MRKWKKAGFSDRQLASLFGIRGGNAPRRPHQIRRAAHVSARGHLRGGVRGVHALLLFDLRRRGRDARRRQEEGHDPRRRPEPHRPGHRVRLLLLPRGVRVAGRRLRDRHGQLESRDRFHRLRHERQTVFRAADARRRAQHLRARKMLGRHRAVRRADPAQPRRRVAKKRRQRHRHFAREHRASRGQ